MGASMCGDPKVNPNEYAYQTLIGLMLSAQTKDEVTHSTMKYLINQQQLSIHKIIQTPELELNKWISQVGFHNKKAKYIKEATQMI